MVNGEKKFTVSNKEPLEKMLDEYKKHYLANIDKKARVKKIAFSQKVEIVEVKVKPEEINTLKAAKEKVYAVEAKAVEIKIKKGDNFWNLSKANKITVDELEILNPDVLRAKRKLSITLPYSMVIRIL